MSSSDPLLCGVNTPRLVLAAPHAGDGKPLFDAICASWHELPALADSLPWSLPEPDLDTTEQYCTRVASEWLTSEIKTVLLWLDDEVIGWAQLQKTAPGQWQLSCWGHSDWQGQGLFAEAMGCLVQLAFTHYQAQRIRMCVPARQQGAWRLAWRLGMRWQADMADGYTELAIVLQ